MPRTSSARLVLLRACSTASFAALKIGPSLRFIAQATTHPSCTRLRIAKNTALAFNRLVDLTECYARCRVSETYAAVAALAKSEQSLSLDELEDLPHHDRFVWRLLAIASEVFPSSPA